jgi:hypothetical protein
MGMGVLAAALPVVLWLGGRFIDGEALRCSMSAYYYSPAMRDTFVGLLWAIGVFLYLYRGFSRQEDWSLNLAGVLAVGIALIPTGPDCAAKGGLTPHTALAVSFFATIAYVCLTRASDTLSLIEDPARAKQLRNIYRGLGAMMILSPLVAVALATLLQPSHPNSSLVFFVEGVAVWTFAAYWLTKSWELRMTNAEEKAIERKLKVEERPPDAEKRQPGRVVQITA